MPVVVGVDGTRSGDRAIAHAFEYAAMTGAPLEAVHAWTDGTFEHEAALVGERLAGWAEKYPEVEVTRCLREGNAAALLLERARRARLIVVGSHSHNRLTGAALGSTSKRLLHLAESPILICRSDSD
jgi:nucleotide-binding universal stress UspA family protein